MVREDEAEPRRDVLLESLETLVRELHDPPAAIAEDVVVVLGLALGVLVPGLAVREVLLVGETALL